MVSSCYTLYVCMISPLQCMASVIHFIVFCHVIFGPPQYSDPPVQISQKYLDPL